MRLSASVFRIHRCCRRLFSTEGTQPHRKGLVLGLYTVNDDNDVAEGTKKTTATDLTSAAKRFNEQTQGRLLDQLNCSLPLTKGGVRLLYGLDQSQKDADVVAVVGLGERGKAVNKSEGWHEGRENVRRSIAEGVLALRAVGAQNVEVDGCGFSDAAAEGAILSLFAYDELKCDVKSRVKSVNVRPAVSLSDSNTLAQEWHRGVILAEGQNFARKLSEMPANLLFPQRLAEIAHDAFAPFPHVKVHARDRAWAEEKKMGSFLSVAQGSEQPPVFLEVHATFDERSTQPPLVLVGKGVTFDTGGISLKPGANMDKMRGDMGGAACVLSTLLTLCRLGVRLRTNVVVLTPLVENMPDGRATRPGDIVRAMNGKSIKIDNTDAEGRLILADALCYADTFKPAHVIDVATLTGAVHVALGTAAAAVYTNSDPAWKCFLEASFNTGDRLWRMPLFKHYGELMKSEYADLNNIAKANSGGGSCTAAGFLKAFTTCKSWAHFDIAGVDDADGKTPYLKKGMTGRPMRTLVESVERLMRVSSNE